MKSSTSALALAGAMILIAGPAHARDNPQTIPGVGNFSLPSSTPTPRPTPTPGPPSIPNAVPIPTLNPVLPERSPSTPAVTPTPTPSRPTARRVPPVAAPTPRATPSPRANQPATPPAATPSSAATPVAPLPETTTPAESTVAPLATPTPTPTPTPDIVAPPAETTSGGSIAWIAGLIAVAALVAGLFLWRRKRAVPIEWQAPAAEDPIPPRPSPRPKAAPTPTPAQPAAPAAPRFLERAPAAGGVAAETVSRPWVDLSIAPRRAGLNLVTATADIGVTLRNSGLVTARNIRIDVRLLSAKAGQEGELGALFATPIARSVTSAFDLAPGTEKTTRALATLLRDDINVLNAAGRPMFVPIVAINVLYDRGDGGTGQTAAAFAIGIERAGAEKLGPFWLDQPNTMHETLGQRPHALALRS